MHTEAMDGTDLVVGALGSVGSAICSLLTLRGRAVRTLEPDHEPEELEAALEESKPSTAPTGPHSPAMRPLPPRQSAGAGD